MWMGIFVLILNIFLFNFEDNNSTGMINRYKILLERCSQRYWA